MTKKRKPAKRKKPTPSDKQTYFALRDDDGGVGLLFYDGTMLEFHTQVTPEEWKMIVEETVRYSIFLDCLKNIGMPALDEQWGPRDEYLRQQLERAVSRMRNIDPLLIAAQKLDELRKACAEKMATGALEANKWIADMRESCRHFATEQQQDPTPPTGGAVSEL